MARSARQGRAGRSNPGSGMTQSIARETIMKQMANVQGFQALSGVEGVRLPESFFLSPCPGASQDLIPFTGALQRQVLASEATTCFCFSHLRKAARPQREQ